MCGEHAERCDPDAIDQNGTASGRPLAEARPVVDHSQSRRVARGDRDVRFTVGVGGRDRNVVREQRTRGVELLAVDTVAVAVRCNFGVEDAGMLAFGLREGVAEAIALQHLREPETLLLLRGRQPQQVEHAEVVLRNLAERRIRSRDDLDHLADGCEGNARAAIDLRDRDAPEAARGKPIKLGGGKPLFAVTGRCFHRELGRERLGDLDGFGVGPDDVRVRREVEGRRGFGATEGLDVDVHGNAPSIRDLFTGRRDGPA